MFQKIIGAIKKNKAWTITIVVVLIIAIAYLSLGGAASILEFTPMRRPYQDTSANADDITRLDDDSLAPDDQHDSGEDNAAPTDNPNQEGQNNPGDIDTNDPTAVPTEGLPSDDDTDQTTDTPTIGPEPTNNPANPTQPPQQATPGTRPRVLEDRRQLVDGYGQASYGDDGLALWPRFYDAVFRSVTYTDGAYVNIDIISTETAMPVVRRILEIAGVLAAAVDNYYGYINAVITYVDEHYTIVEPRSGRRYALEWTLLESSSPQGSKTQIVPYQKMLLVACLLDAVGASEINILNTGILSISSIRLSPGIPAKRIFIEISETNAFNAILRGNDSILGPVLSGGGRDAFTLAGMIINIEDCFDPRNPEDAYWLISLRLDEFEKQWALGAVQREFMDVEFIAILMYFPNGTRAAPILSVDREILREELRLAAEHGMVGWTIGYIIDTSDEYYLSAFGVPRDQALIDRYHQEIGR